MSHRTRAVLQSVDLDTDAGVTAQLESDYDGSSSVWSAKGPSASAPRLNLAKSATLHARWASGGWQDAICWRRAMTLIRT